MDVEGQNDATKAQNGFSSATRGIPPSSLDLDGDGVEVNASAQVNFDWDGDGFQESGNWAACNRNAMSGLGRVAA